METPFILKHLGLQPKRTIRFIGWMNEENGGRGSAVILKQRNMANHFGAKLTWEHAPVGFVFAGNRKPFRFNPILNVLVTGGHYYSNGSDVDPTGSAIFAPLTSERIFFTTTRRLTPSTRSSQRNWLRRWWRYWRMD
jgi:Zn-dependent M28 family amino/carboxypeptidase